MSHVSSLIRYKGEYRNETLRNEKFINYLFIR